MNDRVVSLAAAAALALLIGVSFGEAIGFDFINYDDPSVIVENPVVEGPGGGNFVRVFTEVRDHAWLPLYYASFWIDHAIGGKEPWAYHLVSLVLHWLTTFLLWRLLVRLLDAGSDPRSRHVASAAFLGAACFAVHPIVVESAVWVSGRKDLLSLAAIFGVLLLHERAWRRARFDWQDLSLPALILLLGFMAKASVLVTPLLACVVDARCSRRPSVTIAARQAARRRVAVLGIVALIMTMIHFAIARSQGTVAVPEAGGFVERAATMIGVFARYAAHVVFPVGLSLHYHVVFSTALSMTAAIGLVLLVAIVTAAWQGQRTGSIVGLGAFWFLAALVPFNNVVPRFAGAMADRYLHVALAGCSLAVAGVARRLAAGRAAGAVFAAGAVIVVVLGALTRERARDFADAETVWRAARLAAPQAALPRLQLGSALETAALGDADPLAARRRREEAVRLYEDALHAAVTGREALQSRLKLAPLLLQLGRTNESVAQFEAIESELTETDRRSLTRADSDNLVVTRASALIAADRAPEALELLRRLPRSSPASFDARNLTAVVHILRATDQLGRARDEASASGAVDLYQQGLEIYAELVAERPRFEKTRVEELKALLAATWIADHPIVVSMRARALVEDFPQSAAAHYLKARAYHDVDPAMAIADLQRALALDPRHETAYLLLSRLLRGGGANRLAMGVLDRGLDLLPESESLRREVAATWLAFARHHRASGAVDLALEAAERALKLAGDDVETLTVAGDLHRERAADAKTPRAEVDDLWRRARKRYERALEVDPTHADAKLGLVLCHRAWGYGFMNSISALDRQAPDFAARRDDVRRAAMDEFLAARRLLPDSEHVAGLVVLLEGFAAELRDAAVAARDDVRFEDALALASRSLVYDGKSTDGLALLASIQSDLGRNDEARKTYAEALAIDPAHRRALFESARLALLDGRWTDCRNLAERFLAVIGDVAPDDPLFEFSSAAARMRDHAAEKIAAGGGGR